MVQVKNYIAFMAFFWLLKDIIGMFIPSFLFFFYNDFTTMVPKFSKRCARYYPYKIINTTFFSRNYYVFTGNQDNFC